MKSDEHPRIVGFGHGIIFSELVIVLFQNMQLPGVAEKAGGPKSANFSTPQAAGFWWAPGSLAARSPAKNQRNPLDFSSMFD